MRWNVCAHDFVQIIASEDAAILKAADCFNGAGVPILIVLLHRGYSCIAAAECFGKVKERVVAHATAPSLQLSQPQRKGCALVV